jgi:hypothetical protein
LKLKRRCSNSFGNMCCPWRYQSSVTDENCWSSKRRWTNSFGNMCCPWRYQAP